RREVHRRVEAGDLERVAEVEAAHLVSGRLERGPERATHLPLGAEEGDLHAAARASSAGFTRSIAARHRFSFGPTAEAERRSGASSTPASSASWSASTESISAMMRSKPSSSVSVTTDLPSRLIRFEVDSI